ncbi:MAG: hypothetical protein H0T93_02410 [Chloroflexia bacterium]|nr:hypothetical protein [Chloroflexia bacterium]
MTGDPFDPVDSFCRLLIAESAELEAELGCPVIFAGDEPVSSPAARCSVGPTPINHALRAWLNVMQLPAATEPLVRIDRARRVVVIDGPTVAEVGDAFQLLRTAIRRGDAECRRHVADSTQRMLDTISDEVADTYPSFALRGLEWEDIFNRHRQHILDAGASLPSLQRLFADPHDAHTWVRERTTNARLPYRAWVEPGAAWFTHVPTWSAAWAAGVRAGDAILDVNHQSWWDRTAATPRTRAMVTGYRWLAGSVGNERTLRVRKPDGQLISWTDIYGALPWREPVSASVLESGTGYLQIRGWMFTAEWTAALDEAFDLFETCPCLIVDLRGNVGGQLVAAQHFRDRFLTEAVELGTIRFSIGGGRLSEPAPIMGTPSQSSRRWHKPVRFLIDRQTYSASEDAIVGLQGLSHVQIVGEPSGGGSGRPRTIPLGSGISATVSSALTFDRTGHCVEANGIPVDLPLPLDACFRDPVANPASGILAMADHGW